MTIFINGSLSYRPRWAPHATHITYDAIRCYNLLKSTSILCAGASTLNVVTQNNQPPFQAVFIMFIHSKNHARWGGFEPHLVLVVCIFLLLLSSKVLNNTGKLSIWFLFLLQLNFVCTQHTCRCWNCCFEE